MCEVIEVGDFDAEIFIVIVPEGLVLLEELWLLTRILAICD